MKRSTLLFLFLVFTYLGFGKDFGKENIKKEGNFVGLVEAYPDGSFYITLNWQTRSRASLKVKEGLTLITNLVGDIVMVEGSAVFSNPFSGYINIRKVVEVLKRGDGVRIDGIYYPDTSFICGTISKGSMSFRSYSCVKVGGDRFFWQKLADIKVETNMSVEGFIIPFDNWDKMVIFGTNVYLEKR